ncbi:hypothetical protein AAVH_06382 [Aphelenchoides avenae]|nr:hypothetical protein AAVH_06382 [Aphelenchus avenae]
MVSGMSHNGWYRTNSTAPRNYVEWCSNSTSCAWYTSHAAFVTATGLDSVPPSIDVDNVATNPFFVDEAAGDYNLLPGSKARSAGKALPADIAAAIGVPTSPVDMGALVWRGKTASPATVLSFTPSDDATIEAANPDTCYGADAQLIADNDPRKDFLLKFIVSGVGARTVTKATLSLRAVDPGAAGAQVYQADHNNWAESSVRWNWAPWIVGNALATLPAIVEGTTYTVDVTALVKADGTYGFRVIQPSVEGIRFSSAQGAVKPLLQVNLQ